MGSSPSGLTSDGPSVAPSLVLVNSGPSGLGSRVNSAPGVDGFAEVGCAEPPLGWGLCRTSPFTPASDLFTASPTTVLFPIEFFAPS